MIQAVEKHMEASNLMSKWEVVHTYGQLQMDWKEYLQRSLQKTNVVRKESNAL